MDLLNGARVAKQKYVEKANKASNPMEFMKDKLQHESNNKNRYTLYCCTKSDATAKILKWAFKLAERNVGPFYKQLNMGWQPKIKQAELNKSWARYLIALDDKNNPVAYCMFRFDMDNSFSVLYCYEIQIEREHQRSGLGRFMMKLLESCAAHWQMEKVVLTLLDNNTIGDAFFKAMGYTLDCTSPYENVEYEILSKPTLNLKN